MGRFHYVDKTGNEKTVVEQQDFDANTILKADTDDTPEALTVAEQEVVGRLTSGEIGGISLGIADNNVVQIDHASVADDDYAKFTDYGLEGRSYTEVVDDLTEPLQDLVGAMTTSNTETFISVDYQDGDGTIDFVVPVKNEDNMASDSDTHLATQGSIKAYVDTQVAGVNEFTELTDTPANYTGAASKLVAVNATPDALEFIAQSALDHGSIGGLAGDDHAQYLLTDGSRTLTGDFTGGGYDLNNMGHIGLGNNAADTDVIVYAQETFAIDDNDSRSALNFYVYAYKTSAAYIRTVYGSRGIAAITSSNTQIWSSSCGLVGVEGFVSLATGTASPSTITGAASLYADASIGDAANDMVLTNYYGLYVGAHSLVANSKLTNDYGIYVGAQAGGATLNYAIYTAGGAVYHVGDLTAANIITAGNVDGVDVSAHDIATTGVHGAGGNTILYSDHTADVDAHGEVVITTEDSNTATSNDLALTFAAGEGINTTSTGTTVTITGEAASTTNVGVVELATGGETNTGTSATLAVTPDGLDDWTGSAQITTVGTLSAGDVTAQVSAASDSAAGKVELALNTEVNTGTSTALAVTPDALAGSIFGEKIMYIKVLANDTAVTTGDGKAYITIPDALNGMNLVDADIAVYTKSTSGLPAVSLEHSDDFGSGYNDMLSTDMTIDENEYSSYTAATQPVIDTNNDDVSTGEWIRINVDTAGTGTAGLDVILTFQLP